MQTTLTINPHSTDLWATLLWATSDDDGQPLEQTYDLANVDPADAEKLLAQFYAWADKADDVLVAHGLGHLSTGELLGHKEEHLYALVRDGHGVSMTDDWRPGCPEYKAADVLQRLARAQGPIGAYVADGVIYCSWSI